MYFSHFTLAHEKCEGRRALQFGTHHMDPQNAEPVAAAVGTLIVEVFQTVHGRCSNSWTWLWVEAFHQCFIEPCVSGSHMLVFFLCTFPPLAVIIGTLFPRTPIWLVVHFFRNASGELGSSGRHLSCSPAFYCVNDASVAVLSPSEIRHDFHEYQHSSSFAAKCCSASALFLATIFCLCVYAFKA